MILVTGSLGFIGKHLMKALPEAVGFDIKDGQDITRDEIPKSDIIIHLAAESSVPVSVKEPLSSYQTNVIGTLRVLEACRKNGSKLIFASSCQANSDASNPYALQKHHCEELIHLYNRLYGVKFIILRLYNVFGPGEHGVIGNFLDAKRKGLPLEIYGGQQRRDFVHVDTVVDYIKSSIEEDVIVTIDIGSGTSLSIQEIADMISDKQVYYPMRSGQPLRLQSFNKVDTITVEEYISQCLKIS